MARNLETKARYDDLDHAATIAQAAGGRFAGTLMQTDTYFHAPHGRLKLREIRAEGPDGAITSGVELIAYQRPDASGMRLSTYTVTPVTDAESCRMGLAAVLGVRVVVRKRRGLWLVGATRVHLDDVDDLGRFIELETVITTQPESAAAAEHAHLIALLAITPETTFAGSYSDLLMAHDPVA